MAVLATVKEYWYDFVALLYPNLCCACDEPLVKGEELLCLACRYDLPKTNYHLEPDNPVAQTFWGRVDVQQATAFLHFTKGGKVQHILHHLKYDDRTELGTLMGQLLGADLLETEIWQDIDLVVPVPLHRKKLRQRGYNQSDYFAEGLAQSLSCDWQANVLQRTSYTQSQTTLSRAERWENVKDVFTLNPNADIAGKHILLVDDVITTGATLEACAQHLLAVPGVRVSIATTARAD